MSDHLYLSLADALDIVAEMGVGPVRDLGLLESAMAQPLVSVFGEEAYPGLPAKAAAILHSVVRNHPLVDGNKRLGWVLARTFLALNGKALNITPEEAEQFILMVARGSLERVELGDLFHELVIPRGQA